MTTRMKLSCVECLFTHCVKKSRGKEEIQDFRGGKIKKYKTKKLNINNC